MHLADYPGKCAVLLCQEPGMGQIEVLEAVEGRLCGDCVEVQCNTPINAHLNTHLSTTSAPLYSDEIMQ